MHLTYDASRPTRGPVSNLFKVGRQLNFLSYLGRNEKIILIFRRDARVFFKNVMRARAAPLTTPTRAWVVVYADRIELELFDMNFERQTARAERAGSQRAPRVWNFKNVKKLKIVDWWMYKINWDADDLIDHDLIW